MILVMSLEPLSVALSILVFLSYTLRDMTYKEDTFSILLSSWNSMELLVFPKTVPWNSMELFFNFHGIPFNSMELDRCDIWKKIIIFLNTALGIWLMIICYLAKIAQKRYILHWFQYRNYYSEHPSVSENGTRSVKMAWCCIHIIRWQEIIEFLKCSILFKTLCQNFTPTFLNHVSK